MIEKGTIVKEIVLLTQETLSMAELSCATEYQYLKFRKKYLRLSNDLLRLIEEDKK